MRKTHISAATLIGVVLLLLINVVAFNWTSKFFRSRYGVALVRYGDSMPNLAGPAYSGDQISINGTKPTLVIYLTGSGIKGQTIALLKFCENLRQQSPTLLQTSLITSGLLPEIQQLLHDKLIGYPIVNDSDGQLAKRLGLATEESGIFFFDTSGVCKFASRQQPTPGDLRQLLNSFGLGSSVDNESTDRFPFSKGQPLPSLRLLDARTLQRVTTHQLPSTNDEQLWIFFLADCFACGTPSPSYYLQEFKHWRERAKNTATEPVLVFDSAFLRNEVTADLKRLDINSPAYLADEDLSSLSQFIQAKGRRTDQPLIVRTDSSRHILSASLIRLKRESVSVADKLAEETTLSKNPAPTYTRIFQDLGLDVYDVASHKGVYYVSDRSRNSIVVVNERFEIQREIGGIGSAPGRLFRPGYIDVSPNGLIYVQDGGNERIQCFSIDGTYVAGFDTKPYMGMAAGLNGEVYLGQPENGALVSVYSGSGKHLRSFGKLKSYSELMGKEFQDLDEQYAQAANRVRIFVDKDGSMLVSFMLVPFIQKYTPDGKLVFESRLEGPEIDALRQAPGQLTISIDGVAETILALDAIALPSGEINVVLTDGSIYVADQSGRRRRVIQPQPGNKFTPEMTGITPAGELLIVGMNPRNCYRVSASSQPSRDGVTEGEG